MSDRMCIRCGDVAVPMGHTWRCKACGYEWMTMRDGDKAYTGYWTSKFSDQPDVWVDVPDGCLLVAKEEEV